MDLDERILETIRARPGISLAGIRDAFDRIGGLRILLALYQLRIHRKIEDVGRAQYRAFAGVRLSSSISPPPLSRLMGRR